MNELLFTFDRTAPSADARTRGGPVGDTAVRSPVPIVVRSAGEEQGAFGHIYVNGRDESPNRRGYNFVVVSPTGEITARAVFDTFASPGESARLAEFVNSVPQGHIVAVAAADEASYQLTAQAVDALRAIGADLDLRGRFRWSHAIVGVQGAPPGSALESASETRVSQLLLGDPLTEPFVAARFGEIRIEPP
jgi:hypothetical protein